MTRPDTPDMEKIFLKPAELCISERPVIMETILGSCVAITMFHKNTGIAAMCHAIAPSPSNGVSPVNEEKYRYVTHVIPEMVTRFRRYGICPTEIEVKIFGGAEILFNHANCGSKFNVGRANIKQAIPSVEAEGLKLKTSDVSGNSGRKIYFHTHTGEVLLKRIKKTQF